MSLIICRECGKEFSNQAAACPNCGCPTVVLQPQFPSTNYVAAVQPAPLPLKKPESVVGIIGLVFTCLSFIPVLGFVGFILCFIAVCSNKTKSVCGAIGIGIAIFSIILAAILGYADTSDEPDTLETTIESTPITTATPAPLKPSEIIASPDGTVQADDGIIDTQIDGCSLKYIRHEIKENRVGDACLVVYYEFTNNSNENVSFSYTFSDQAFQNGIELERSVFSLEDEDDNSTKEIKPGVTIEVYSLFTPQDNSDVELELSEWISFDGKIIDTMVLSLE